MTPRDHAALVALFLAAGLCVFAVGTTLIGLVPAELRLLSQAVLFLGLVAATLAVRRSVHPRPHWRLVLAYAVALCALVLSEHTGDWAVALSGHALETVTGFTALKLGEDAAIVGTIVLLALLTRDDPRELYLCRGRLGLGLAIGIPGFLLLCVAGVSSTLSQGIPEERVRELLPAFALIALADGFMEELLFRGLFLKRLGRLVGDQWALVVTALVFVFAHVRVQFAPDLPAFLAMVLLLGLLWGWLMQRTGSILAPTLVHAGVDMLIIADVFAAFGIEG